MAFLVNNWVAGAIGNAAITLATGLDSEIISESRKKLQVFAVSSVAHEHFEVAFHYS